MKTILAPPSSKLSMPSVNLVITNFKNSRIIEGQQDPSYFKSKIPVLIKEKYIIIAEKCMTRIFEDQKKVYLNILYFIIVNWNFNFNYNLNL